MTELLAKESLNHLSLTSLCLSLGKSTKLPLLTFFYVNLAEKFQILPFIGSHEGGVTCNGVSEPPMLNIHFLSRSFWSELKFCLALGSVYTIWRVIMPKELAHIFFSEPLNHPISEFCNQRTEMAQTPDLECWQNSTPKSGMNHFSSLKNGQVTAF